MEITYRPNLLLGDYHYTQMGPMDPDGGCLWRGGEISGDHDEGIRCLDVLESPATDTARVL